MQELEKILEEINKRIDRSMLYSYQHAEGLREAKGIILKHMNDAEYPYIVGKDVKDMSAVNKEFLQECKKTAEKYRKKNDGWIPVEKRLPEPYQPVDKTEKPDWRRDMLRKFDRRSRQ